MILKTLIKHNKTYCFIILTKFNFCYICAEEPPSGKTTQINFLDVCLLLALAWSLFEEKSISVGKVAKKSDYFKINFKKLQIQSKQKNYSY